MNIKKGSIICIVLIVIPAIGFSITHITKDSSAKTNLKIINNKKTNVNR